MLQRKRGRPPKKTLRTFSPVKHDSHRDMINTVIRTLLHVREDGLLASPQGDVVDFWNEVKPFLKYSCVQKPKLRPLKLSEIPLGSNLKGPKGDRWVVTELKTSMMRRGSIPAPTNPRIVALNMQGETLTFTPSELLELEWTWYDPKTQSWESCGVKI